MSNNEIVIFLDSWIKHSPYTREDLCKILKITQNTMSNWCTGKTHPSVPQLLIICELLNVKFEDIYKLRNGNSLGEK